jgi:hypothetical protein
MVPYLPLIELGLAFLKPLLDRLTTSKAPQNIIDATQVMITALDQHKNDIMSKADWEKQRG